MGIRLKPTYQAQKIAFCKMMKKFTSLFRFQSITIKKKLYWKSLAKNSSWKNRLSQDGKN